MELELRERSSAIKLGYQAAGKSKTDITRKKTLWTLECSMCSKASASACAVQSATTTAKTNPVYFSVTPLLHQSTSKIPFMECPEKMENVLSDKGIPIDITMAVSRNNRFNNTEHVRL